MHNPIESPELVKSSMMDNAKDTMQRETPAEELHTSAENKQAAAKEQAKKKAGEEWALRIMEELNKAAARKEEEEEDTHQQDLSNDSGHQRQIEKVMSVLMPDANRSHGAATAEAPPEDHAPVVEEPRQDHAEEHEKDIMEELREEIHRVKFPEKYVDNRKAITFINPDGKRVKQLKDENEELVPVALMLAGKGKKGAIYVRADGKKVRLVKKKDKKRREKRKKQMLEAEMIKLNQEAELRAQLVREETQRAEEQERQLIEQMSWQADEEEEKALEEAWQDERATKSDEHKRMRYSAARQSFAELCKELVEKMALSKQEEEEIIPEEACPLVFEPEAEEAAEPQKEKQLEAEADDACSGETASETVSVDSEEMYEFLDSLQHEAELSPVKRMALESIKALERAYEMKRLARLSRHYGDMEGARIRAMNQQTRAANN